MASSAKGAVWKEGQAEGSPWPNWITGRVSFGSRFSVSLLSTPLIVKAEACIPMQTFYSRRTIIDNDGNGSRGYESNLITDKNTILFAYSRLAIPSPLYRRRKSVETGKVSDLMIFRALDQKTIHNIFPGQQPMLDIILVEIRRHSKLLQVVAQQTGDSWHVVGLHFPEPGSYIQLQIK
ncbi:lipid-transfer protein [Striga asiatica]|uniref:Lipid-transfer protein n=1 Tax=Striga asiatica TaxID=4170 RepID=A0A5A7RB85_STRAF|nr:lipid-transfer protein [Striga asiatica]